MNAPLPPAMQFPDVARATVVLDGRVWGVPSDPSATKRSLGADLVTAGTVRGRLTVQDATDLAFLLPEEENLLDRIAHAVGLWLDHRDSEAMLRASEARHRHLFEAAGTGLGSACIASTIRVTRPPSAEMSGFDRPEDLYDRNMIDLIALEDRQRVVRETQLRSGASWPPPSSAKRVSSSCARWR